MSSKNSECVKVVVRCRPLSSQEVKDDRKYAVSINTKQGEINVNNPKADTGEVQKTFTFDLVYDWTSTQEQVYKDTAFPIVESVLEGYNGTIFAYGQTGTGKTFTMEGKESPPDLRGIMPRSFEHIFKSIEGSKANTQFLVRASFLELYNEEIRDLLAKNVKNKLEIREKPDTGVFVKDLSAFMIQDSKELIQKLDFGRDNRHKGETLMNRESSRSHSIFSVTVEMSEIIDGQSKIRVGKLNLVDLAGSERQSKTQATGDRFKEAININQSLTTLGNVISALVDQKYSHIPYRDSKLTRLLQDSLGGNTKTVMVANIGPADYNFDETLSTLRYAHRAKSIKNKPHINEDPKDALLRQFQEEIAKLKAQLAESVGEGGTISSLRSEETKIVEVTKIVKIQDTEKIKKIEQQIEEEKRRIRESAERERKVIEEKKNLAEDERMKLLKQLEEKEEAQRAAKEQQQKLLKKIKKMEEKLIQGHTEMEDALHKERELLKAKQEIEEKKQREKKLEDELREKELETADLIKKYKNQEEEAQDKTKKIKLLWNKLKQIEADNKELDEFYAVEINELQERRRALQKELKLKNLIIEYFIPEKELQRLELRALYNEDIDDWVYPKLELAGNILRNKRNQPDPLEDPDDANMLEIFNHPNVYFAYTEEGLIRAEELAPKDKKSRVKSARKVASAKSKRPSSKSGNRVESAKKKTITEKSVPNDNSPEINYPKARGLVPTKK